MGSPVLFTIIFIFNCILNLSVHGKVFQRCELAKNLLQRGVSQNDVLEWVCIAEFESSFDTTAINKQNTDGSWDWGLFQINDRYWCNGGKETSNICRVECNEFLKDDITKSFNCAKRIKDASGYGAWVAWNNRCQGNVQTPKTNQEQEENNSDSDSEDIDSEEEGETGVIEKTFKFEDFTKRLVNLKVVRACTVVLSQWEKIPTKTLKAAVTILHRIAYGSHCPAMLYQAILFKIFQSVMDAPREQHHEELRRLAIYVIRKFVETAPSNPKIYAELLFYKTIREANELETGYCDNYEAGIKGAWSQEQEDELRILFEENQRNPETDKDVIDWILDNLIDKTRTRRGILKKLKEMGLMFKAPTKKSSVANKNLWQREEDEQLKELYDEHRLDEKCLSKIVEVMGEKRSQRAIVKRMIELHLIADKSEILPSKRGKKSQKHNSNSTDESDSDDWITSRDQLHQNLKKTKKKIVRKVLRNPLDLETLKDNISELNEDFISVINWLIESLQEASEDIEQEINNENNSDSDVPLFPITTLQIRAVEDENFRKILEALGLKSPQEEISTYWRIPSNFKATDLKLRIKALKDESIDENDIVYDEVVEYQTDEEATVKARKQKKLSKKKNQPKLLDKLLKKSKKQETRKVKKNPLDIETIRTLISQIDDKYKEAMEWLAESIFDAADDTEEANNEEDGIPLLPMLENQKDAMENDDFKKLLIALGIQPPIQEIETYWRIPIYLKTEDLKKRAQILRGQEIEGEDDVIEELHEESNENDLSEHNESSSNESGSSKDGDDFFDTYVKNRREKMQSLVYNDSDNDDGEIRKPLKKKPQRKLKAEKKENKKDLETKPKKNEKKIKKKGALNLDDMVLLNFENPLDSNPDLDFDSENLRLRLAELSDEEDEENKMNENFPNTTVRTKKKINLIESDDDDDDNEKTIGNTSLNNFNMNSQTTNNIETNSASIQHHRRHRRNIIDSDSDEESNNITETNENLNYNSITNTTTNDYGHSKENIEKENLSNLYEIDSMKDITGKLNQDEDDLMDEIEANNQSSIYNKTTKITTTTTTVNDEDDDNNDETIVGTSSATTNFINNIKSSETNFVLKLDDNGDSISMISNDITSITKTSTLLSSSTKSTQLNIKHGQISDIDNDSDKNIIINADETNDVDGNSDGVIDTINKEKRKLKNNLSSDDDDDDEDIIVKRRKIVNTNDDINVIDDEKDDNNRKIPEHKYRRIANIIDDADDDDE